MINDYICYNCSQNTHHYQIRRRIRYLDRYGFKIWKDWETSQAYEIIEFIIGIRFGNKFIKLFANNSTIFFLIIRTNIQKYLLLINYAPSQYYKSKLPIYAPIINYYRLVTPHPMPYKESMQYVRNYDKYGPKKETQDVEDKLLSHILAKTPKGDPQAILKAINEFSENNWMMHLGEEKGQILVKAINKAEPKQILQLGTYCGFSSLLMAANSDAMIHTFQPNQHFAFIAHQIHQHAGLADRIDIHVGVLEKLEDFVKNHGKFDFIVLDHERWLYLRDFKELERIGAIHVSTTIFADNIIYPGVPDYHEYMKHNAYYDSTLYHSYNAYSNTPDGVLVSLRIAE